MTPTAEPPSRKIINGSFASILDFPHQAFILIMEATYSEDSPVRIETFGCAVLINDTWLLTAAHVMLDKEQETHGRLIFKIILGVEDLTQNGTVAEVELYRCHPNYQKVELIMYNDLCLVKTRERIQFSDRVRPVALPLKDEEDAYREMSRKIWLSGFGMTYDPYDTFVHLRLRHIEIAIIPDHYCSFNRTAPLLCALRPSKSGEFLKYTGAGGPGDSGSGMVGKRPESGDLVLLGILSISSFLIRNGIVDPLPSIDYYAKVSHYLDWIRRNTV